MSGTPISWAPFKQTLPVYSLSYFLFLQTQIYTVLYICMYVCVGNFVFADTVVFFCVCLCRLLLCVFLVSDISISWIWILSLNLWILIVLWVSEELFWLWLGFLTLVDFANSFWSLWNFWMLFDSCFFDDMNGWLGLLTMALSGRFNWIATLKFRSNFWVIVLIYVCCYDVKLGVYGFTNSIWIW